VRRFLLDGTTTYRGSGGEHRSGERAKVLTIDVIDEATMLGPRTRRAKYWPPDLVAPAGGLPVIPAR